MAARKKPALGKGLDALIAPVSPNTASAPAKVKETEKVSETKKGSTAKAPAASKVKTKSQSPLLPRPRKSK